MSTTAALVEGHHFRSYSGPLNARRASCECGQELPWEGRDEAHAKHLLAVAFQEGIEALALATLTWSGRPTNPYREDRT